MEGEEDGEERGNAFSFYNYNLILRLNWSFKDSYEFENPGRDVTNRDNCQVLSLINSQLLKAESAWWELLVHPWLGCGPQIPQASHFWQGHRPGDASQKPECIWDVSEDIWKPNQKNPTHSKLGFRALKPWHGAKRSMRNSSCLQSCPRSCPHGSDHPHLSSAWAWSLQTWAELFPVSQLLHKIKVIYGGQCGCVRLTHRSKQPKNNLKLPLGSFYLCLSFKIFSASPNKLFFHFGWQLHSSHVYIPPLSIRLRHARNRARVPVTLGQTAMGVYERASHHGRTFSSSRGPGREWMCGQGHRRSNGMGRPRPPIQGWCSQLKGHLHCKAPYLNV